MESTGRPESGKLGTFALDMVCIFVPFETGGGAAYRATQETLETGARYANHAADAGQTLNRISNGTDIAYDVGKSSGTINDLALCFIKGTPVLTEDGLKAIECIKPGERIWAEDSETGEKVLKEVVQTFVNESNELIHITAGGEKISATPEHPFYVRGGGWTGAIDLKAGDVLVLQDGGYVIVEKIEHEILERPVTVYNFLEKKKSPKRNCFRP